MGVLLALAPLVAMAHGISEDDRQRMLDGGYMMYIGLGASHMLTGYDHLLFLFGVVFFLTTFRDVAKDKSKETLYMFFTSTGNFIAANFTGQ
ncbi:MAG: HupE/UreJ family protein [Burkholderiaceae bacterium]